MLCRTIQKKLLRYPSLAPRIASSNQLLLPRSHQSSMAQREKERSPAKGVILDGQHVASMIREQLRQEVCLALNNVSAALHSLIGFGIGIGASIERKP